jgi:hypothetical protein
VVAAGDEQEERVQGERDEAQQRRVHGRDAVEEDEHEVHERERVQVASDQVAREPRLRRARQVLDLAGHEVEADDEKDQGHVTPLVHALRGLGGRLGLGGIRTTHLEAAGLQ